MTESKEIFLPILVIQHHIYEPKLALAGVTQLVVASSPTVKGGGFYFQSDHILRLRVPSPVGVHMVGN